MLEISGGGAPDRGSTVRECGGCGPSPSFAHKHHDEDGSAWAGGKQSENGAAEEGWGGSAAVTELRPGSQESEVEMGMAVPHGVCCKDTGVSGSSAQHDQLSGRGVGVSGNSAQHDQLSAEEGTEVCSSTHGTQQAQQLQRRGALLLNGRPARASEMRRLSSYIPQVSWVVCVKLHLCVTEQSSLVYMCLCAHMFCIHSSGKLAVCVKVHW